MSRPALVAAAALLACSLLWASACGTERARRWFDGSCSQPADCGENGLCIQSSCARSCKTTDECGDGVCLEGHCVPPDYACDNGFCNDGNSCTDDACEPASATCSHTFHPRACDDKDPCTIGDECIEGGGGATVCTGAAACDDGDATTTDSCSLGVCSFK